VSLNFTLFRSDGTPVRAEAQVTFTAYEDDNAILPFQNPSSRSESRSMYLVRAGETLDYIAYVEYGDPNYWRHLADVNGLTNPLNLKPGQVLKVTPLPD
jgi:nucleoid-associated protein YgaU